MISFAIPKDIWEAIYNLYDKGKVNIHEMRPYIRLDLDTSEYIKVFEALSKYANPYNERNTKKDDEDYDPNNN